jgi:bla regulator protein blaR1
MLALVALALIVGVCLACCAAAAERLALNRPGTPVRWIWLAAMALTIAIPLIRALSASGDPDARGIAAHVAVPTQPVSAIRDWPPRARLVKRPTQIGALSARVIALRDVHFELPAVRTGIRRRLVTGWCLTSVTFALLVLGSLARLRRDMRRWPRVMIDDTPVLVSDGLGPALVGVHRPAIVVPPWVLELDDATKRTILMHERAHCRAGDTWLLAAAGVLVIAMPWHAILWWMRQRLYRAVELDCDARVVASGMRRVTYADHLLRAYQHASGGRRVALAVAFAERRSVLSHRVSHMLRPTSRRPMMLSVSGVALVVVFGVAAIAAPTPRETPAAGRATAAGVGPAHLIDDDAYGNRTVSAQRADTRGGTRSSAAVGPTLAGGIAHDSSSRRASNDTVHHANKPYKYFGNYLSPDEPVAKTIVRVEQSYAEDLARSPGTASDSARARRLREHRLDAVRLVLDSLDKLGTLGARVAHVPPTFTPR